MVKWIDNQIVQLVSSYVGIGNIDEVKRWSKTEKQFINVMRPEIVKEYNMSMGGDKLDFLVSLYRIYLRSKKWTLRAFFHFIDLDVTNSWIEYHIDAEKLQIPKKTRMDLLHFRNEISLTLIKMTKFQNKKVGRPRSHSQQTAENISLQRKRVKSHSSLLISVDAWFDYSSHWTIPKDLKDAPACKQKGCKGRSRIFCEKWEVYLSLTKNRNCFKSYYVK